MEKQALQTETWQAFNQRYLMRELAKVRTALVQLAGQEITKPPLITEEEKAESENIPPPALTQLCESFGLSPFERQLLLLCAGVELEADFASLCAVAHGDPQRAYPSFGLALSLFAEPSWQALMPQETLRYWHFVSLGQGTSINLSPLKISESVLFYLLGMRCIDEQLEAFIKPLTHSIFPVDSHQKLSESIAKTWAKLHAKTPFPLLHLQGDDAINSRGVALSFCEYLGLQAYTLNTNMLPTDLNELEVLCRLLERESILRNLVYLFEYDTLRNNTNKQAILLLLERLSTLGIVISQEPLLEISRYILCKTIGRPSDDELLAVWQKNLNDTSPLQLEELKKINAHFNLDTSQIHHICHEFNEITPLEDSLTTVWQLCCQQVQPRLEGLVQRVEPKANWEDLVLPETQLQMLHMIAMHVSLRQKVYGQWGFANKYSRGLGISALFYGPSGTGKTLAAEILAHRLAVDLYHIDLSSIVSKYIGETEKNLKKIFNAAEQSGAVLLFDEADALFGKRSDVKDSHDRYANIEVSYLLQRIEAYKGLVILTSNLKSAIDIAFIRRIRFFVSFPFPDREHRAKIWERVFPDEVPTQDLVINNLASLNLVGGHIYNIALNAAFIAAGDNEPVQMKHLLHAAQCEYTKLEKPLTDAEVEGW